MITWEEGICDECGLPAEVCGYQGGLICKPCLEMIWTDEDDDLFEDEEEIDDFF